MAEQPSTMDLATEERRDLAAYLRTLSDADWDTDCICGPPMSIGNTAAAPR